ncbi:MAG: PfkB family carbohydrate kinase, partial [Thermomicrobiales bacterium]
MSPVLAIGETLIDLIVEDGAPGLESAARFIARDGGAPANVAVALARLGIASAFGGVVGDDPFGGRLRAMLNDEGVDTTGLLATSEAPTSLAFAWKDERGDGHFQLLRLADRLLTADDVDGFGIEQVAALVVGSVALAAEPSRQAIGRAVELAVAAKVPVIFDVNLRPSLWPDLAAARDVCLPIIQRSTLL